MEFMLVIDERTEFEFMVEIGETDPVGDDGRSISWLTCSSEAFIAAGFNC